VALKRAVGFNKWDIQSFVVEQVQVRQRLLGVEVV
jgi:hypothetical protein